MIEFLDDLKAYLEKSFAADKSISADVPVVFQYTQAHVVRNEIQIMGLNDSTEADYESYESENIAYVPIQIVPVTGKQSIAGKTETSQRSAIIYAQKIQRLLEKVRAASWNANIMRISRVGSDFAIPYETGSAFYVAPMRFDVYVRKPYASVERS